MIAVLFAAVLASAAPQPGQDARPPDSVPVAGVDDAPRRGTWVEASLGVFTAMGGTRPFSSGQPYLGMTLGRDLGKRASIFASLGLGAASASCYQRSDQGSCLGADSFGFTFLELGLAWAFPVVERFSISLKALGGFTDLSPGPVRSNDVVVDHVAGFHAGAGLSFDYDTRLDHFGIGLDAVLRETFARSVKIASLAVMPRIRYVF
jgi:hypothetical protein